MDDLGFYYFQKKETTSSKEDTNNSKHATTQKSAIDLFNGMAQFFRCFIKNFDVIISLH
jgi:hypothetical protein